MAHLVEMDEALSVSKRDYYEVLGVARQADAAEIKKAYRKMAMQFHPDRNSDDPNAEEKLKEVNEAASVLLDEEKRSVYDRYGHEGLSNRGFSGGFDVSDLFQDFFDGIFGGGGGRGRGRAARGRDMVYETSITFEEAARGVEKVMEVPYEINCKTCDGSGAKVGTKPQTCRTCGGAGEIRVQQGFFVLSRTCPDCGGAGKVIKDPCSDCKGTGRQALIESVELPIPAGAYEGLRIRMRGRGEKVPDGRGQAGDLYVTVHVEEHPLFQREEDDVICEVPVSFVQASLGAKLDVPTLEGIISMKIPPGTQSGTLFRLKGKGFVKIQDHGKGDQIVRVAVEIPTQLNAEQKELLERFEAISSNGQHTPARSGFIEKLKSFFHLDG